MNLPYPLRLQTIGTLVLFGISDKVAQFYDSSTGESGTATKELAGEALAKGEVLCSLILGTGKKITKIPTTGASHSMPIGVVLTAASGDGEYFWMAQPGSKVQVLPESGITAAKGNVLVTSTSAAGRVAQYSTVPTSDHWDEVGHWLEDGTGNGALTLAFLHFN